MGSCGADGNMFSYELVNPKQTTLVELPSSVVDGMYKGEEVKGSYSLEEDKQKSEMDRKIKEANLLKENKRKKIKELIKVFEQIKSKNTDLPEACRLTSEQFELNS